MKNLAAVLVLFILCPIFIPSQVRGPHRKIFPAASVTWNLIQNSTDIVGAPGTGASQNVAMSGTQTSIAAGDTVIILSTIAATAIATTPATYSSSTEGTDTLVHCPAQYANLNSITGDSQQTDCVYVLSSTGAGTNWSFTWTLNALSTSTVYADAILIDIKRSTGTATFDSCTSGTACIATNSGCTSCAVPTPTITGTSDYCVQWINSGTTSATVSSISGGSYTNPFQNLTTSNSIGAYAGALNQSSVIAQNWNITASVPVAESVLCFK
jgi:hypothetical protein